MSKGPGTIQRLILDATRNGGVHPLLHIMTTAGHDITKLSVRQSFSRAARRLADDGYITLWATTVPTIHSALRGLSNPRDITCVSARNVQPSDEDWTLCRDKALTVFFPETMRDLQAHQDDIDRAAESVIRILEQGDREISRDHVVTLLTGSAGTTEEGSREHFFEGLGLVPGVRDYLRDNADGEHIKRTRPGLASAVAGTRWPTETVAEAMEWYIRQIIQTGLMNRKFANKLKLTRNIAGEITREGTGSSR